MNESILNFRDFLNQSWPSLHKVLDCLDWDENPYFVEYWIQANWEILVENQALESGDVLEPYGYGKSPGDRYLEREKIATHRVICEKKSESNERYIFLCFLTKIEGNGVIVPPFDYANAKDFKTNEILSLPIQTVNLTIERIPSS